MHLNDRTNAHGTWPHVGAKPNGHGFTLRRKGNKSGKNWMTCWSNGFGFSLMLGEVKFQRSCCQERFPFAVSFVGAYWCLWEPFGDISKISPKIMERLQPKGLPKRSELCCQTWFWYVLMSVIVNCSQAFTEWWETIAHYSLKSKINLTSTVKQM